LSKRIELLGMIAVVSFSTCVLLVRLAAGRSRSLETMSLSNLRVQAKAHANYAATWSDRQSTSAMDEFGQAHPMTMNSAFAETSNFKNSRKSGANRIASIEGLPASLERREPLLRSRMKPVVLGVRSMIDHGSAARGSPYIGFSPMVSS